jgi:hypothetical protein
VEGEGEGGTDNQRSLIFAEQKKICVLKRSKEFIDIELGKFINIVGQEYYKADYIYKNNISEVNSYLNKKYDIPNDFIKIEEFIIDGISIYEIYKKTIK